MEQGFQDSMLLQILAGLGLAAAAGLRAFLPPLVVGLLARLDLITLRGDFHWLASDAALIILGAAVIIEILGDKIPLLDHVLDVGGTFIKPAAGAVVLAAPLLDLSPLVTLVLAVVVGGSIAETIHLTKSGLRLASTGTTSGLGNPALSVAEDGLSLSGAILAVFYPVLLLALLLIGMILLRWLVRWMQSRSRPPAAFS